MKSPIPPLIIQEEGQKFRLVTPQEKSNGGKAYTAPRMDIAGSRNQATAGKFSADSALRVFVTECVYPGGKDEPISNKWVYVMQGSKILAEAHAQSPEAWKVSYDVDTSAQPENRPLKIKTKGFFELRRGQFSDPQIYGFFLSPLRLTPKGFSELLTQISQHYSPIVRRSFSTAIGTVGVPDPWRWARDAHILYYQPLLDHYQRWIFDPDNTAKLFIAGVLNGWMENGDPANVEDKLAPGQPTDFVHAYQIEEADRRLRAEEAMAYVAGCVQASEHRVIELSADESGDGHSFAYLCIQFGAVSARLSQCEPGRQFALDLVQHPDRLPAKHLFADSDQPETFKFPEGRFAWLAALATFDQLAPAAFGYAKKQAAKAVVGQMSMRELIRNHLRRLGVLTATDSSILSQTEPPSAWYKKYRGLPANGQERLATRLLVPAVESQMELARAQELTGLPEKLEHLHRVIEPWIEWFKTVGGTVVEGANLYIAISELQDARPGRKGEKVWSVVGASADAAGHLLYVVKELLKKRLGSELGSLVVEVTSGALGVISGACDMHDFLNKAEDDMTAHDYGQAVGHSIAAVGAGSVAIGGGLALGAAIAAEASGSVLAAEVLGASTVGGPPGMIIGAVGSVLILTGCVIAAWTADNYYQDFAKLCCFKKEADVDVVHLQWASGHLGYDSPVNEANVLRNLLSNFVVTRVEGVLDDNTYVSIRPGYMPDGSRYHFWCNVRDPRNGVNVGTRRFVVAFDGGLRVVQAEGVRVDLRSVELDSNQAVESFTVVISTAGYRIDDHFIVIDEIAMAVDLDGSGRECTPAGKCLLSVPRNFGHAREYNSIERSNWVDEEGRPVD